MFDDILKFGAALALLVFAILTALGMWMYLPYIVQAVLMRMH